MRRFVAVVGLVWGLYRPLAVAVDLTTREVALDGQEVVHTVAVTGAPSISTNLVFPDAFQVHSVSCGDCIHVRPGELEAASIPAPRPPGNWLVEKHPERRTIIIRPAVLPSARNPVSGFKTNLVVGLDNGHVVNVVMSLVDLRDARGVAAADAVVHMRLPEEATATGLLSDERRRMRADFDAEVEEAASGLFLERLFGDVRCRRTSSKPYRSDRTVVRVRQLCTSASRKRTFWCLFDVQNRSASEVHIERVELVPEAHAGLPREPGRFRMEVDTLNFDQSSIGIATSTLEAEVSVPSSWRLEVVPGTPDREAVRVSGLVF